MEQDFDFDESPEGSEEEILPLFHAAVDEILRTEDSAVFLDWIRREAPALAPELFAELPEAVQRAAATGIGRALWNLVPLPGNGSRPRPLPQPGRNDPCPCGSGRKYKRCCAGMPEFPGVDAEAAWGLVLDRVPLDGLAGQAEVGRLPRWLAGEVASRLVDDGQAERALGIVEPIFGRPERCDERDAEALDALLDAYDALDDEERMAEAVERLHRGLRPPLLRQLRRWEAMELHNRGRNEEAWEVLERLEEEDPDDPMVGTIMVTLLLAEDRCDEAADLARSWLEDLEEDDLPPGALDFLRRTAADPEAAAFRISVAGLDEQAGWIDRLERLLAQPADPAAEPYGLDPVEGDEGAARLAVPEPLARLERRWAEVFAPGESEEPGGLWVWPVWEEEAVEAWLGFLEQNPGALGSLAVLDDLTNGALEVAEELGLAAARPVLRPLLARARAVLDRALAGRPGLRLPFRHEANRPVFRLLSSAVVLDRSTGGRGEALRGLEDLMRLDPEDPFGLLPVVLNERLRTGDDAGVLELAARFPHDPSAAFAYGEALALFRLGRKGEALSALDRAVDRLPLAAAYLAAEDPRRRRVRGADREREEADAWAHRQAVADLWAEEPELLAWLRTRVKAARKRLGRRGEPG